MAESPLFRFPPARLLARPQLLAAAVAELAGTARSAAPPEGALENLRQRLRTERAVLVASSLRPSQHRWLVALAAEQEADLGLRIAQVALERLRLGSAKSLLRLIPWLPHEVALRNGLAGAAEAAHGLVPGWLETLGGLANLTSPDLAARWIEPLARSQTPWPALGTATGLPAGSPLALEVLKRAVHAGDERWAHAQSDGAIATWTLDHALPAPVAIAALESVLLTRIRRLPPRDLLRSLARGGVGGLLSALEDRLGGTIESQPRRWEARHERIRWLAKLRRRVGIVLANFERRRRDFWIQWLVEADDVEALHAGRYGSRGSRLYGADAVAIHLRGTWFVEFPETGNACYAYEQADFERLPRHRFDSADDLKLRSYVRTSRWLTHQGDWESKFRRFIDRLPRRG